MPASAGNGQLRIWSIATCTYNVVTCKKCGYLDDSYNFVLVVKLIIKLYIFLILNISTCIACDCDTMTTFQF